MIGEVAVALPLILWMIFRFILPPGPYEFDHGPNQALGTFFALLPHWQRLFWIVAAAGIGGAVYAHHLGLGWAALLLFVAAIEAFLFNAFMVLNYESYLATKYPRSWNFGDAPRQSNYTLAKYALSLALGITAVVTLLAGAVWVAWGLA